MLLPGGPLQIAWSGREGSVLMTGPAEAVFDGVLSPDLIPSMAPAMQASIGTAELDPDLFDCAKDCSEACLRPDNCLRDEAQQKVQAFLNNTSLDSMLNLASESLEQRIRSRYERSEG